MRLWNALLLSLAAGLASAAPASASAMDALAIKVGRAETVANGTIEHAVILVENGKIVVVGQDLEIARGIPVLERPDWVVIPGLVDCYSRVGLDGTGGGGSEPHVRASRELYPRQDEWSQTLEHGVTTLGLYPAGNGIPGLAVAVRPRGDTPEEMIVRDGAYLLVHLRSNPGSKKMLRDGFEEVDKYLEKEQKAFEKWEKDKEKADKKKKDDKDKDKEKNGDQDGEKEEEAGPGPYVPPAPDEKVKPFMDLRDGTLSALISIEKASDWLHLLDVIEDEEFQWSLRIGLQDDVDVYHVVDAIGERGLRVVVEPALTFLPATRRDRNLPDDFARAGAKVAFTPNRGGYGGWLVDVGRVVRAGMDPQAALRALTLEPAAVLGVESRLGSIEPGKDANFVFLSGAPFEPATRIEAVMLEGDIVFEEDAQ